MRKPPITISTDRDTIRSSAEFKDFVEQHRVDATRRKDDRLQEIAVKQLEIQRGEADHQSFMLRAKMEISALEELVADDEEILAAADRALTLRPSPQLTPNTTVADALSEERQ